MLRPGGEHDVLRVGRHPEVLQPCGHGLTMPQMAASRRIAKQLRPRQRAPLEEMRAKRATSLSGIRKLMLRSSTPFSLLASSYGSARG
jgi:hypothetical protein